MLANEYIRVYTWGQSGGETGKIMSLLLYTVVRSEEVIFYDIFYSIAMLHDNQINLWLLTSQ